MSTKPPPAPSAASVPPPSALRLDLAEAALHVLEEQLTAKIVHYKAELQTNPELDAITAQVVADLRELQGKRPASLAPPADKSTIRAAHVSQLAALLQKVLRPRPSCLALAQSLKNIHRRLARLFFESELYGGSDLTEAPVVHHAEQAVHYALQRRAKELRADLDGFAYASPEARDRAVALLDRMSRDMQDAFLALRSSELRRIANALQPVLVEFLCKVLHDAAPAFAEEVVHQAGTFEGRALSHRLTLEAFPRFRAAFERRFTIRLVGYVERELVADLVGSADPSARERTAAFLADPQLFAMLSAELCTGIYEHLHGEGFLDLPAGWAATER
jgi:hypothetical protein